MEYIESLAGEDDGCFLCRAREEADDPKNLVLHRGRHCFAVLNRFPYTGGHSLVAPYEHLAGLGDLDDRTMLEMFQLLRDLRQVLVKAFNAKGFNIGINLGRCAGAGLPGHLHAHIVPRWSGDVNFMTVFGEARVIPISLEDMYAAMRNAADELGLLQPGR